MQEQYETLIAEVPQPEQEAKLQNNIDFIKTRTDATFPLAALGNKKVKHETLLYNLNKIINNSNISNIIYTEGGEQQTKALEPINNMFCDNMVLYVPIPDKLFENLQKIKEIKKKEIENDEEEEEEEYVKNKEIQDIAKLHLPSITNDIKQTFIMLGIVLDKTKLKPVNIIESSKCINKPSKYLQLIKVDCANIPLQDIFGLISNKDKMEILNNNNIYIHDIDFTRDFKGVFNKDDLIDYLDLKHGHNIKIVDNNQRVSKNCLTFLKETPLGLIRYKFYNKFVQTMESPSVRSIVGNHIKDWCNNPEKELKNAIENSLDTGILRLEFTIYRYNVPDKIIKEKKYKFYGKDNKEENNNIKPEKIKNIKPKNIKNIFKDINNEYYKLRSKIRYFNKQIEEIEDKQEDTTYLEKKLKQLEERETKFNLDRSLIKRIVNNKKYNAVILLQNFKNLVEKKEAYDFKTEIIKLKGEEKQKKEEEYYKFLEANFVKDLMPNSKENIKVKVNKNNSYCPPTKGFFDKEEENINLFCKLRKRRESYEDYNKSRKRKEYENKIISLKEEIKQLEEELEKKEAEQDKIKLDWSVIYKITEKREYYEEITEEEFNKIRKKEDIIKLNEEIVKIKRELQKKEDFILDPDGLKQRRLRKDKRKEIEDKIANFNKEIPILKEETERKEREIYNLLDTEFVKNILENRIIKEEEEEENNETINTLPKVASTRCLRGTQEEKQKKENNKPKEVEEIDNLIQEIDVKEQMDYLQNIIPPEQIYYNSIQNQFNLLCENILYNLCIVDLDKKIAFVCLYINKLTGKCNGFYTDLDKLNNALRWYCSNKPIVLVLMEIVEDLIEIQQDTYLRFPIDGKDLFTYVNAGSENLKITKVEKESKQPKDIGLIPNDTFNFIIPKTTVNLLKQEVKLNIQFKQIEFPLLSYPDSDITIKKYNANIREDKNLEDWENKNKEKIEEIKKLNQDNAKQTEQAIREDKLINQYRKFLDLPCYSKLTDIPDGTELHVYAFAEKFTKFGRCYKIVTSTDPILKPSSSITTYWSNYTIEKHIKNLLDGERINMDNITEEEWKILETVYNAYTKTKDPIERQNIYNWVKIYGEIENLSYLTKDQQAIYINITNKIKGKNNDVFKHLFGIGYISLSNNPLFTILKEREYITESKNKAAKVIIKNIRKNNKEEQAEKTPMLEEIDVKADGLLCLDSVVKEDDVVKILGYKQLKKRVIIRAELNNKIDNYLCSYWLKEILNKKIQDKAIFNVIAGVFKTTPQRHKALTYTC